MIRRFTILLFFILSFGFGFGQTNDPTRDPSGEVGSGHEPLRLFIPNAFTPNNDGINDQFYITNSNFAEFQFSAFDRWGNMVYQSKDCNFRWDGSMNGKDLPSDIYVFVFSGTTTDGVKIKRSGTISIVR